MPAASSRPWSPTTSTSAARTLIELIFKRGQTPRRHGSLAQFKTKIVTYGTEVNVNAFYRHSRIKQYLNCDARSHAMSDYVDWRVSRC